MSEIVEPLFERLKRAPAYKAVSQVMEERILDGTLPLGAPLPSELELAAQFGVHRSTIREAIRQLEQEGLLERRSDRRLFVAIPGVYDLAPRATRSLMLQQVTFSELWQLAVVIEPQAAYLAAINATEQDIALLRANVDKDREHLAEGSSSETSHISQHAQIDVAFHALVGSATHNRALILAREPISLLYRPALGQLFANLPQAEARNLTAHEHVLEAIIARDEKKAEKWARKHLIDFQRGYSMTALAMDVPLGHLNPSL
jgi:GntR family transcriptional regulator, transcriptional repressor for pyruvate dehydrogenase complex